VVAGGEKARATRRRMRPGSSPAGIAKGRRGCFVLLSGGWVGPLLGAGGSRGAAWGRWDELAAASVGADG